MKSSKLFITSLLAAATMSAVPAYAETDLSGFSGTIYTWAGRTTSGNDLAFGYYYTTDTSGNFTAVTSGQSGSWGNVQSIIGTNKGESAPQNTLRFVALNDGSFTGDYTAGDKKTPSYTFTPLTLGGIIVESGATGFSISASGTNERSFMLGNGDSTAAKSVFHESFTLTLNTGSSATTNTIRGTQTWTIDENKTFTITSGNNALNLTGATTINGGGTAKLSGSNVSFGADASIDIAASTTLDFTETTLSGVKGITNAGNLNLSGATVSLANAIQNSGTVTVSGTTVFNLTDSLKTAEGVYTLITGGIIDGWGLLKNFNFTYYGVGLDTMRSSSLDFSTEGVVTLSYSAANLTWTGASSTMWDVNSTPNWTNDETPDKFYNGDNVTFSDDAAVTVADSGVTAGTVNITAGTVSFTGGKITAAGGVSVTGGTLSVGADNTALGTNTITLSGGTLAASDAGTLANAVNVAADSEINTQAFTLTLTGAVSGTGTLTKTGAGTLTLTPANFSLASLKVASGEVTFGQLSSASFGASTAIEVGGNGNVNFNLSNKDEKTFSGSLVLKNGGKITKKDGSLLLGNVQLGETSTDKVYLLGEWGKGGTKITGSLSGAATAYLANAGNMNTDASLGKTDGERFVISGSNNSYSGTLIVGKQNENTTSATHKTILIIGSENALKNAKINLALGDKSAAWLGASSVTIAGLEGTANSTVALNSDDPSITSSTLTVNQASDTTFAGTIGEGISLKKTGAGTLTLSGANTYTGATTVEAGTLVAANANALDRTTGVEVRSGATLERGLASGSVAIGGTLTTNGAAILSTGALSADTAAFAVTGNVTLSAETIFDVGALANGQVVSSAGTLTVASGTLTEANFLLNGGALGGRTRFTVSTTENAVTISSLTQNALELTWAGGDSDTWKANGSGWNVTTSGSAETFQTGDSVTFSGGSSGVKNVVVDGVVSVGTMTIDSDANFAFSGQNGAAIGSSGALTKTGTGTATIASTVDLSRIEGGIEDGIVVNGGKLVVDTASGYTGAVTAGENGTFTLNVSSDTTLSNTLSVAGTFEKTGAGTLTVASANARLTGQFVISKGTVKLGTDSGVFGADDQTGGGERYAAVVKTGGTLDINGQTEGGNNCYKLELAGGALVNNGASVGTNQRQVTGLKLSADSTIGGTGNFGLIASGYAANKLELNGHTLTKTGTNTFWLTATTVKAGTIDVRNGALRLANGNDSTELFSMESGSTIKLNGGTIYAGSAGVALGNVAIVLTDANKNTARITAESTNCSFNAGGATLYLDIGALTAATLTPGENVSLTIAAASAIANDSFFSSVEVGTYVDDVWLISSEWKYLAESWNASAGTLSITAIPEPSVFGLLAGLGALALAGTRRRRKKA